MSETIAQGQLRNETFIEKLVQKKSFWLVLCLFLFSYPIYRSMLRELPQPLPVYGQLPVYSLTNEFGKPFGSQELRGKVYMANFIFTSCPSTCRAQTQTMQTLQKRVRGLGNSAGIVSFTVDPTNDTPEKLYRYAREFNSNPKIWNFLTGTEADLKQLLLNGFKVPMGEKVVSSNVYDLAHSERIVLVDGLGRIRGYYSNDSASLDKLMIDIGLLANLGGKG